MAALLSGSLDIAFIGPVPALTGYERSHGAISIIAGSTSGGAELVTRASIASIEQLNGKAVADPALGGTQDIALRYYLKQHGVATDTTGGGRVKIQPMASNGLVVSAFRDGTLAGAWMPEPYSAEMVNAGGHVLVDEAKLWPGGKWATTNVVVRTAFLRSHPAAVRHFLEGLTDTLSFMQSHTAAAEQAANAQLAGLTSKSLPPNVLDAAWHDQTFTVDPLATTLKVQVAHAVAVGLLKPPSDLASIFRLAPLNDVLRARGHGAVVGL
jgi:NitT/TauT family transport system substrate-binding protein